MIISQCFTFQIVLFFLLKNFSPYDAKSIGRPRNFSLTVREVEIASGAGFIIPITGKMLRMPGLPETPAAEHIDIDGDGNISGLF